MRKFPAPVTIASPTCIHVDRSTAPKNRSLALLCCGFCSTNRARIISTQNFVNFPMLSSPTNNSNFSPKVLYTENGFYDAFRLEKASEKSAAAFERCLAPFPFCGLEDDLISNAGCSSNTETCYWQEIIIRRHVIRDAWEASHLINPLRFRCSGSFCSCSTGILAARRPISILADNDDDVVLRRVSCSANRVRASFPLD